jgi:hypothetical protein
MLNEYSPSWPSDIVFGSFKATGIIVEGERGFRAQIGEVEALVGLGAAAWAEKYNVPLVLTLEALAERFPPTQLPAMMPKKADITASSRRPIVTASSRQPIVVPNAWMNTPGAWVGWHINSPLIDLSKISSLWASSTPPEVD